MVKLLILAFLYKEMLPKDVCHLFSGVFQWECCQRMSECEKCVLFVAVGFLVGLFCFLVVVRAVKLYLSPLPIKC